MVYIECSVSNTTTKDIKYTVCLKRTVESNPSITLCEPLESLTKGDHSITDLKSRPKSFLSLYDILSYLLAVFLLSTLTENYQKN